MLVICDLSPGSRNYKPGSLNHLASSPLVLDDGKCTINIAPWVEWTSRWWCLVIIVVRVQEIEEWGEKVRRSEVRRWELNISMLSRAVACTVAIDSVLLCSKGSGSHSVWKLGVLKVGSRSWIIVSIHNHSPQPVRLCHLPLSPSSSFNLALSPLSISRSDSFYCSCPLPLSHQGTPVLCLFIHPLQNALQKCKHHHLSPSSSTVKPFAWARQVASWRTNKKLVDDLYFLPAAATWCPLRGIMEIQWHHHTIC